MNTNNKQLQTLGFAVLGALVAVIVIIVVSDNGTISSSGINFDDIPQYRTADGAYVLGDPDTPLAIVEFTDYLCSHCQTYKETIDEFVRQYVATGQARLEYRLIPTQRGNSEIVARLSDCAYQADSSKFWESHDELYVMASRHVNPSDMGRELAETLDISYSSLFRCTEDMRENENEQYHADILVGIAAGVTGTPTIFVRYGDDDAPLESLGTNSPSFDMLVGAVILARSRQ